MGWCRETVKPAIKAIRRQLTRSVLQQLAEYMALMQPLIADGNISGQDAEKAVVYAVAAKNNITKTAAGMGVKLIHETTARGNSTLNEWAEDLPGDDAGTAELDTFLEA